MMQKIVDHTGAIVSPFQIEIPTSDLFSYVISSGDAVSRKAPQYFDATAPSVRFSLEEAETMAKRFARGLEKLGLKKQEKVLMCAHNHVFFPIALWGVTAAGGVFTGCSPTASAYELEYQLRDSEAKFVFAAKENLAVAAQAAEKVGLPSENVFLFGPPDHDNSVSKIHWMKMWASTDEVARWSWRRIDTLAEAASTTAVLNYSSGTTGLPKGVELSHYNLISNAEQVIFKCARVANTTNGKERSMRMQSSGERWLAALPLYHAFGQGYFCILAPRLQAKVYVMSKFNVSNYLTYADIYRITFMNAVPAMQSMMCRFDHPASFNLKAIESVTSGAAPLDPMTAARFQELFLRPGVFVKQGWGMTETAWNATGFSPDDEDDGRSIGWLNPNCKATLFQPPGEKPIVGPDGQRAGELWVSGPNIMKGYWKKEAETNDTLVLKDGERWLRTGDIAYADDRGCFYIIGRTKELIKVNGFQVSPAELEKALMGIPGIEDVAIVGAKIDGDGKEYPRAFVVRKNQEVTSERVHSFVRSRFAKHKWLSGGVFFIDSIPRNPSGKILRRALPNPKGTKL